jgi:hypothetical protein
MEATEVIAWDFTEFSNHQKNQFYQISFFKNHQCRVTCESCSIADCEVRQAPPVDWKRNILI